MTEHGWELTVKSLFPDSSDLERADLLDFGVGRENLMDILSHGGRSPIHEKGIQSVTKVLHAARDSLGLEFCPLLPEIACLLLSFMPVRQFLFSVIGFLPCIRFARFHTMALCNLLIIGELCVRNNPSNDS
jgi:hypothetical protein